MTKGCERQYILKILEDITKKELFVNQVLDDYYYVYDFDKQQRSFISRIVYGVVENRQYLDFCINQVSNIKINKMKPTIRIILRMSVYQLLFMDKVPSHAAINEGVKLASMRKFINLKSFVNGVLRNVERQKGTFETIVQQLPMNEYLSVRYSINQELVGYLLNQYSSEQLENFLRESQKSKDTCIRTNMLKISTEQLKKKLESMGDIRGGNLLEDSFYLSGYDRLFSLAPFILGEFQVQDESSTLVGMIANPKSNQMVLDICAAPGGKTTHLSILMENRGKIVSCDISESKTGKIQENCQRLGLTNVDVQINDASIYNPEFDNAFDLIVADVPCSGLGILRSKPDIKQNMTLKKIESLILLQRDILENVKKYVKVDGEIIYSTCTINNEENALQVNRFLNENPEFIKIDLIDDMSLNHKLKPFVKEGYLQLITDATLTDGFFIAKLKKIKE